jgi:hypothetical protein
MVCGGPIPWCVELEGIPAHSPFGLPSVEGIWKPVGRRCRDIRGLGPGLGCGERGAVVESHDGYSGLTALRRQFLKGWQDFGERTLRPQP